MHSFCPLAHYLFPAHRKGAFSMLDTLGFGICTAALLHWMDGSFIMMPFQSLLGGL